MHYVHIKEQSLYLSSSLSATHCMYLWPTSMYIVMHYVHIKKPHFTVYSEVEQTHYTAIYCSNILIRLDDISPEMTIWQVAWVSSCNFHMPSLHMIMLVAQSSKYSRATMCLARWGAQTWFQRPRSGLTRDLYNETKAFSFLLKCKIHHSQDGGGRVDFCM